jgi:hypothetical protein
MYFAKFCGALRGKRRTVQNDGLPASALSYGVAGLDVTDFNAFQATDGAQRRGYSPADSLNQHKIKV